MILQLSLYVRGAEKNGYSQHNLENCFTTAVYPYKYSILPDFADL